MTVRELIERLAAYDLDKRVGVEDGEYDWALEIERVVFDEKEDMVRLEWSL